MREKEKIEKIEKETRSEGLRENVMLNQIRSTTMETKKLTAEEVQNALQAIASVYPGQSQGKLWENYGKQRIYISYRGQAHGWISVSDTGRGRFAGSLNGWFYEGQRPAHADLLKKCILAITQEAK